jgi:hypothetical protein
MEFDMILDLLPRAILLCVLLPALAEALALAQEPQQPRAPTATLALAYPVALGLSPQLPTTTSRWMTTRILQTAQTTATMEEDMHPTVLPRAGTCNANPGEEGL